MNLTIYDRITLAGLLPEKTNTYEQAIIARDLRRKIILTQEELISSNVRTENQGDKAILTWDSTKNTSRDFDFTTLEIDMVNKAFSRLFNAGEFPTASEFIALYEKFKN